MDRRSVKIAPSILAADFGHLAAARLPGTSGVEPVNEVELGIWFPLLRGGCCENGRRPTVGAVYDRAFLLDSRKYVRS